ncbi:MAG: hypothetical protein JW862_07865 [Anaerolineales bacterium]|nr:hypothetical protein [Anaerolineales bacterium]
MEFERLASLTLPKSKAPSTQVDYRVCEVCGFRLMRVETVTIHNQALTSIHCPICGFRSGAEGFARGRQLSPDQRRQAFEGWLARHNLSRQILQRHYRLEMESFFVLE